MSRRKSVICHNVEDAVLYLLLGFTVTMTEPVAFQVMKQLPRLNAQSDYSGAIPGRMCVSAWVPT